MTAKLLASGAAALAAIGAAAVGMTPVAMASTGPAEIQTRPITWAQSTDEDYNDPGARDSYGNSELDRDLENRTGFNNTGELDQALRDPNFDPSALNVPWTELQEYRNERGLDLTHLDAFDGSSDSGSDDGS